MDLRPAILSLVFLGSTGCVGPSALMQTAIERDAEKMDILLSRGGRYDVEERDHAGRTLLMVAIEMSPEDLGVDEIPRPVQVALDHGADVNAAQSSTGFTALTIAIEKSCPTVLQALLDHGARFDEGDLERARERREERLESYGEHHDFLTEELGSGDNWGPMQAARRRMYRAERVINVLLKALESSTEPAIQRN